MTDAELSDLETRTRNGERLDVPTQARLLATIAADRKRIEALEADLHDFNMVINHCSRTYDHFSGGRISKPNTFPEEVFAVADELEEEKFQDWLKDEQAELLARAESAEARCKELEARMQEAVMKTFLADGKARGVLACGAWNQEGFDILMAEKASAEQKLEAAMRVVNFIQEVPPEHWEKNKEMAFQRLNASIKVINEARYIGFEHDKSESIRTYDCLRDSIKVLDALGKLGDQC